MLELTEAIHISSPKPSVMAGYKGRKSADENSHLVPVSALLDLQDIRLCLAKVTQIYRKLAFFQSSSQKATKAASICPSLDNWIPPEMSQILGLGGRMFAVSRSQDGALNAVYFQMCVRCFSSKYLLYFLRSQPKSCMYQGPNVFSAVLN